MTQTTIAVTILHKIHYSIEVPKAAAAAAAAAPAVIALKFHPKHATNKNKTKHIMKISHINVYDKTATSQQNSD